MKPLSYSAKAYIALTTLLGLVIGWGTIARDPQGGS